MATLPQAQDCPGAEFLTKVVGVATPVVAEVVEEVEAEAATPQVKGLLEAHHHKEAVMASWGASPPAEFNGDCAQADAFLNEFNLYCITNIDMEQMINPMKHTALFLGFIKGENVKDWVKKWTNWILNQINTGRPTCSGYVSALQSRKN